MTWFSNSDILEIFCEAQEPVARKLRDFWATHHEVVSKPRRKRWKIMKCEKRFWAPARKRREVVIRPLPPRESVPLPSREIGTECCYCREPIARVVRGLELCEAHAERREMSLRTPRVLVRRPWTKRTLPRTSISIPPLVTKGVVCLYCDETSVREIGGMSVCRKHVKFKEAHVRNSKSRAA